MFFFGQDANVRETLLIPIGRLDSLIILIEKAKSSKLLVKRQKALNSSNVMLYERKKSLHSVLGHK